jgi:ribosomal protein S18 acetylase RimI-like enzyme
MTVKRSIHIRTADSEADLAAVVSLCSGFLAWNRVRYADLPWLIERYYDPSRRRLSMDDLRAQFAPPQGAILLGVEHDKPIGCVMMRGVDAASCEMKHLFVEEHRRGSGIGRTLCETAMHAALAAGYRVMRIETGRHNTEAIRLYETLGFKVSPPPCPYPADMRDLMCFMEAALDRGSSLSGTPAEGTRSA